jgi:glycosyltransferase involved in cell wall biosynthesis
VIRVAHFLPTTEIGGRERIVADLCEAAPVHGIEPLVITYDRPAPGRTLMQVPVEKAIALDRRHVDFGERLRSTLAEERVDVLHAQGHACVALANLARCEVPMVASIHLALGEGWRWLMPLRRGLRAAAHVTAVSQDLARRYRWLARRPIHVIPTGVDVHRFAPAKTSRDPGAPFTIGIAARLHPVKRVDVAVKALRVLIGRGIRCRLVIAGEGPLRSQLEGLALGLPAEFRGAVSDMPAFMRELDAFLSASDHEGTPAALLEAMATGLPCVATGVGGVPALLDGAGLLVSRRNPTAIAGAVAALVGDFELRSRLGACALHRARRYSVDLQASAFAGLYRGSAGEHLSFQDDGRKHRGA